MWFFRLLARSSACRLGSMSVTPTPMRASALSGPLRTSCRASVKSTQRHGPVFTQPATATRPSSGSAASRAIARPGVKKVPASQQLLSSTMDSRQTQKNGAALPCFVLSSRSKSST